MTTIRRPRLARHGSNARRQMAVPRGHWGVGGGDTFTFVRLAGVFMHVLRRRSRRACPRDSKKFLVLIGILALAAVSTTRVKSYHPGESGVRRARISNTVNSARHAAQKNTHHHRDTRATLNLLHLITPGEPTPGGISQSTFMDISAVEIRRWKTTWYGAVHT